MNEKRDRSLDSLRGVAALGVLTVHLGQQFDGERAWHRASHFTGLGMHGVAIFFTLSSFLLTSRYISLKTFREYRLYLVKRFFRIYPAYLLCLLCLSFRTWPGALQLGSHVFLIHFLTHNILFGISSPFWSLAIEFWFYVTLPLFVKCLRSPKSIYLLILIINISIIWEGLTGWLRSKHGFDLQYDWSARFFILTTISSFVIGAFFAIHKNNKLFTLGIYIGGICACLEMLLGILSVFSTYAFHLSEKVSNYTHGSLGYIMYSSLTIVVLGIFQQKKELADLLILKFFTRVGIISYSMYLWHLPILTIVINRLGVNSLSLTLAVTITFLVASLSYYFVERPFIAISKRITAS